MIAAKSEAFNSLTNTCVGGMNMKHSWIYNVLWMAVHVFCIIVSCLYIKTAYHTWQSSPVVQAVSTRNVNYKNISFPAVTICWPNSLNRGYNLEHYVEKCLDCESCSESLNNTQCSHAEMATLALAYKLCFGYGPHGPFSKQLYDYVKWIDGYEFNNYLKELVPPCESDVLEMEAYNLKSRKKYTGCDRDLFQNFYSNNVNTLCMTYNSLRHEDVFRENVITPLALVRQVYSEPSVTGPKWSYDNMMRFKGGLQTVPIYGLDDFTFVTQKQERHYENTCKEFKKNVAFVFLHSPNEVPLTFMGESDIMLHENTILGLILEPKITLAKPDLADYPPQQRGCYFSGERDLGLFKFYTKKNCDTECEVNQYLEFRGCVPYYYPRHNESVNVCIGDSDKPTRDWPDDDCECLPDCNHLTYDVTSQEVPMENNSTLAQVRVFYKEHNFYITIRYRVSSYAEFLAFSLGVLGTFLGFSVTCVWKLLYFGFIRLWTFFKAPRLMKIFPLHEH